MPFAARIILACVFVVVLIAATIRLYRRRKKQVSKIVSLVALLREPKTFDPAVLAHLASKVWNADLGDGTREGEDGHVMSTDIVTVIRHGNQMYLLNCFPRPYVDDVEAASQDLLDLRIRELFVEHQAWISIDALGVDDKKSENQISYWYRQIGGLLAELLDDNCLLIFVPESGLAYAINDETEKALRSDNPRQALRDTMLAPMFSIPADDPEMQQAVVTARETWPQFVAAFEARSGENHSVKAPISYADNTEFIWLEVTAIEGDLIFGTLGNDPANLGPLKVGAKVSVPLSELNDWCYIDTQGEMQGGFTVAVFREVMRRRQKS